MNTALRPAGENRHARQQYPQHTPGRGAPAGGIGPARRACAAPARGGAAGTPREIVARLNTDLLRVLALPEVTQRIEAVGNEVPGSSPEESLQILRAGTEKWARLVKERNIRFQ